MLLYYRERDSLMLLRYGLLSTSSIAPRLVSAVRAGDTGQILAVSSRTQEKADAFARQYAIPRAYGDHAALLNDKDVDIVYISNVNAAHYVWAKAALEHGKHVLCEKPCTTTRAQTRELYALAKEKGLFFMEAEKMLFLPAIEKAKALIDAGALGQIYMVQMNHSFPATYNGWMFDRDAGGGPLLSSGIYAIHLILYLLGEIRTISGQMSTLETGVEWQYILTGQTESGALFTAANSTRAVLDNTARIFGTKGYLELPDYWKARQVIVHTQSGTETADFPCEYELVYETRHVKDCLEKGIVQSDVVTPELSAAGIGWIEKVKADRTNM